MLKLESILSNCYENDLIKFEDIHALLSCVLNLMNQDDGVKNEYKINYGKQSWETLVAYCDPC